MRRTLAAVFVCLLPTVIWACTSASGPSKATSLFMDIEHFHAFADERMSCVDPLGLLGAIFGPASVNSGQMRDFAIKIQEVFPSKLTHSGPVRREDMGSGFFQEIRAYWADDMRQAYWMYAFGQIRQDGRVNVMTLDVNTASAPIFAKWQ